ncbi:MAG: polyprenyl synthetase family protein [Nitriliruptoraceae bacterium]
MPAVSEGTTITTPAPAPRAAVPPALAELRPRIDAALDRTLAQALPRLGAAHPSLEPQAEELRSFLAGGKRIRPGLLMLGFRAAGGQRLEAVEGPAVALELLHACALLHDDVIDQAPQRRGRPSVHEAFAAQHRQAGWVGDAEAYGRAVAILLGDLAFTLADEAFLEASVPSVALLEGFRRYTVLREEVMIGQALDLHAATARLTDRQLALQVATLKSGRYSVARPLELGAVLAGADEALVAGLLAFGDPLGRAFQLADDLLGVVGDPAATGKSTSSDLEEGKRTLLIAEAAARLDAPEQQELEAALGRGPLAAATVERIRRLLDDSGALAAVREEIDRAIAAADAALAKLELPGSATSALREVAGYLGERSS